MFLITENEVLGLGVKAFSLLFLYGGGLNVDKKLNS